jgi:hypothetical protein
MTSFSVISEPLPGDTKEISAEIQTQNLRNACIVRYSCTFWLAVLISCENRNFWLVEWDAVNISLAYVNISLAYVNISFS